MIIGLTPLDVQITQESMCLTNSVIELYHDICLIKNYVVEIPSRSDWIGNNVELKEDIVCYIDGSRMESRKLTGANVFDETHNKQHMFPLGKQTTVYQAELYAILMCVVLMSNSTEMVEDSPSRV